MSTISAKRCEWCGDDPQYVAYHDEEWGVPVYDGRKLYENLMLESFQAGLSWITILRKRDNFRQAFDDFDPAKIAQYDARKIEALLQNQGIIRHRGKIEATIKAAQIYLDMGGAEKFSDYIWSFVDHKPIDNQPTTLQDVPASTPLAEAVSKDLKAKGFKFTGPSITYAFMQASGLVNDHAQYCEFR